MCDNRSCSLRHPSFQSNEHKMESQLVSENQQFFECHQGYWSGDEVVNVRKEPIAVDLQIHDGSPDHRNIRQATVDNLERKISIPKNKLDLYYSVCEPEALHVKSLKELQRERDVREKLENAKRKQQIVQCNTEDLNKMEANIQVKPVSRQLSAPHRRLISESTIHAQLDQLESLPLNLVPIALVENTQISSSSNASKRALVTRQSQQSQSYSYESQPPFVQRETKTSVDRASVLSHNPVKSSELIIKKGVSGNQEARLSASKPAMPQKTVRMKSKSNMLDGKSKQPYSNLRKNHRANKVGKSSSSVDVAGIKTENSPCETPNLNTRGHLKLQQLPISQPAFETRHADCASPVQVVSDPSSPLPMPQEAKAKIFWRSHSTPSNLNNQVSLTRLSKLSDSLTGVVHSSESQRRPVVADVLNVTQEELSFLQDSFSCVVKKEPLFEPSTPPDSSDDDIIWDDEIDDSEDIHHQTFSQSDDAVLDIYEEDDLSDSEYLLERTTELLQ